jgi:nucleotide-binding universal stress UspA family protein
MYPRVLVAHDGSTRSLSVRPVAAAAARAFGSQLDVIHVVGPDASPPDLDEPDLRIVEAADTAAGLIDAVRATIPPALLCLSTHGRGPIGELVFGSIAAQLLRGLHHPLVMVGPELDVDPDPGRWSRMLVCLDGSATSATIVPVVRSWALELELELHLLHVAYPLGDPLAGELRIPDEEEAATDQLIVVADALRAEGIDTTWEVDEDTHAASGIVAKLRHRAFDLVALATHGRTGLSRLLAGSVATDVVRRAPAPVLLLRPEHLR